MRYYIFIIILLLPMITIAQNGKNNELRLYAKSTPDGVLLKFMPDNPSLWIKAAQVGYSIRRSTIGTGKDFTVLNTDPILPFKDKDWAIIPDNDSLIVYQNEMLWNVVAHKDDELSQNEVFMLMKNLENMYGLYALWITTSRNASRGSGMEYLDQSALPNTLYQYEVVLNTNNDKNLIKSNALMITHDNIGLYPPQISDVVKDKRIEIKWKHKIEGKILSYTLEKSFDGKVFFPVNNVPKYFNKNMIKHDTLSYDAISGTATMRIIDSLQVNYQDVFYRLKSADLWGEPTHYSQVLKTHSVDLTPPSLPSNIETIADDENNIVRINWKYKSQSSDLLGFIVFHSIHKNDQYTMITENILGVDQRAFVHNNPDITHGNYYRIGAIDKYGNYDLSEAKYIYFPDKSPPNPPLNIKFEINKKGEVLLDWNKSPESDFYGYAVYASNNKNHHFTNITPTLIKVNHHVDKVTLKRLDHYRYYKVKAIDKSYNFSEFSELTTVKLPDIIAPATGRINEISMRDNTAFIIWVPSPSDDVKAHLLYRKDGKKSDWKLIQQKQFGDDSPFEDELKAYGRYRYAMKTEDMTNNISNFSFSKSLKYLAPKSHNLITLDIHKDNDKVALSWKTDSSDIKNVLVYRKINGEKFKLLTSVKANQNYKDYISPATNYAYYVVGQAQNGVLSKSSSIKKIKNQ